MPSSNLTWSKIERSFVAELRNANTVRTHTEDREETSLAGWLERVRGRNGRSFAGPSGMTIIQFGLMKRRREEDVPTVVREWHRSGRWSGSRGSSSSCLSPSVQPFLTSTNNCRDAATEHHLPVCICDSSPFALDPWPLFRQKFEQSLRTARKLARVSWTRCMKRKCVIRDNYECENVEN